MSRVIAVLNPKGGSGKTTLATHIASAFHRAGEKTLLVDSDIQGSARDWKAVSKTDLAVIGLDRPSLDKDLAALQSDYQWTIIDGAAKLEKMIAAAVKAADMVLIPVQPSPYDVWACATLVDVIHARRTVTDGRPACAFVLTRAKKHTILAREIAKALTDFGLPVLQGAIHDRTIFARSVAEGSTALDMEPEGEAAFEINRIIKQVREAFA